MLNLFFPESCLACNEILSDNEIKICSDCRHELPLTHFHNDYINDLEKIFFGRVKLENATALFRFSKGGKVQKLLHNLKYRGHQQLGSIFGDWLSANLKSIPGFNGIDTVIPVPLHSKRKRKRGYNQVSLFAKSIAHNLNYEYSENILVKKNPTKTQVFKKRKARWLGEDSGFRVKNEHLIQDKHILIVDDLVTTGSTLEACANALSKKAKIKLSIATIAIAD